MIGCSIRANFLSAPTGGSIQGFDEIQGAGMFIEGGRHVLNSCTFSRNSGINDWGCSGSCDGYMYGAGLAISMYDDGEVTNPANVELTQCAFSQNITRANFANGGGLSVRENCTATLNNCSFGDNRVRSETGGGSPRGGGAYVTGELVATNCIFWGNGVNGYEEEELWVGSIHSIGPSLPGTAEIASTCVQGLREFIGNGNVDVDPDFTSTLRLGGNSGVVDLGNNVIDISPSTPGFQSLPNTDLAGQTRIVDGDGDGLPTVDLGAYEYQPGV
jgi:hypothetical protein